MSAGYQSQHGEDGHTGGSAVAEEGEGQTDNGHNTDAHADVDHHLEHQSGACAKADQTAHIVLAADANVDAPGNDEQLQDHDEHTTEEAQLLADGGENVVGVLGVQVAALGTVAVEQTLAGETAAGKGLEIDLTVITFVDTLGVNGGVEQNQNSVSLIITQELP